MTNFKQKRNLAENFINNQNLSTLQLIKNEGMNLYKLKNNNFEILQKFNLPYDSERMVVLYDSIEQTIQPIGVSVF